MGLGNKIPLSRKTPAYRGGHHFGESEDSSDDDDEKKEESDIDSEILGLKLSTDDISPAAIGVVAGKPVVLSDDGAFLYCP
jgi:hypothetical protein